MIQRSLQALEAGDWDTLRALCLPTVCYYALTRSAFSPEQAFIGIEAYLTYAQLVHQRLPDFHIDQVVIFQHAQGLIARYRVNWQGEDGQQTIVNSAMCRFSGERLRQIAVTVPTQRLRMLLEPP